MRIAQRIPFVLLVVVEASSALHAQEVEVELVDGSEYVGTIVTESADTVTVLVGRATMSIPRSQISSLR